LLAFQVNLFAERQ